MSFDDMTNEGGGTGGDAPGGGPPLVAAVATSCGCCRLACVLLYCPCFSGQWGEECRGMYSFSCSFALLVVVRLASCHFDALLVYKLE
jgi:hypothetical protein